MSTDSDCQVFSCCVFFFVTFEADGDALAERFPDQVPGGYRQLLTW